MHRFGILLVSLLAARLAWAETLEMVTYYPAPGGGAAANQDLHVRSLTVGIPYAAVAPDDGEALIFDWLGIGTNAPAGPLHVVGADDAASDVIFMPGADTAAAGVPDVRVGIGTAAPQAQLHVNGGAFFQGGNGDVDGNGALAMQDVTILNNYFLAPGAVLQPGQFARADVTGDGQVTDLDRLLITDVINGVQTLPGAQMWGKGVTSRTIYTTIAGWVGIGTIPTMEFEVLGGIEFSGSLFRPGGVRFLHDFGTDNTFLGRTAGNFSLTTGGGAPSVRNTGIGASALDALTTGIENTAVGVNALGGITTGYQNTAVGEGALGMGVGGNSNTAIGRWTMREASGAANQNVAVGWEALVGDPSAGAPDFKRNTGVGVEALGLTTTGDDNVAVGYNALANVGSGNQNVAIGSTPAAAMRNGSRNVFIGYDVGSDLSGPPNPLTNDRLMIDNSNTNAPLIDGNFATNTLTVNGGLTVTGNITTGNITTGSLTSGLPKTFEIPHPAKPGYTLTHAVLEGPEIAVFYRGEGRLEGGKAEVLLPDYFEKLTREEGRTVTLTAKGAEPYLLSYEEVKGGRFTVHGTQPDGAFSWEVKAVCSAAPPLEVEKPAN